MKKIINGKMYNTETAHKVGAYSSNQSDELYFVDETLFRKKGGEFFLYCYGGAGTKYAESCGQNWWGAGEQIIPLSNESALKWAEEHMDADDFEEEFGEVPEDDDTVRVCISMPASDAERLRRAAQAHDLPVSKYIVTLIRN